MTFDDLAFVPHPAWVEFDTVMKDRPELVASLEALGFNAMGHGEQARHRTDEGFVSVVSGNLWSSPGTYSLMIHKDGSPQYWDNLTRAQLDELLAPLNLQGEQDD